SIVERGEEIGEARYEKPLEIEGNDELAQLGASIESMRRNILIRDLQMKMMLSGIAHEVRNPLGGMELFAGILEKENLTSAQLEYVNKIKTEIQSLKKLLNEFLDYAGPKRMKFEPFRIEDLMVEIETLLAPELQAKQGRWVVRADSSVGVLTADRSKLRQALLNLYRNALQAIPTGGEVLSEISFGSSGTLLKISNTQTV